MENEIVVRINLDADCDACVSYVGQENAKNGPYVLDIGGREQYKTSFCYDHATEAISALCIATGFYPKEPE